MDLCLDTLISENKARNRRKQNNNKFKRDQRRDAPEPRVNRKKLVEKPPSGGLVITVGTSKLFSQRDVSAGSSGDSSALRQPYEQKRKRNRRRRRRDRSNRGNQNEDDDNQMDTRDDELVRSHDDTKNIVTDRSEISPVIFVRLERFFWIPF